MVEMRCSDETFESSMNVLVDVITEMLPGCDRFFKDIVFIEFVGTGDEGKLGRYASDIMKEARKFAATMPDPKKALDKLEASVGGLVTGQWSTYTINMQYRGNDATCKFMRIKDNIVDARSIVDNVFRLLGFPEKPCTNLLCSCNGKGTVVDYESIGIRSQMQIVDEWMRRVS